MIEYPKKKNSIQKYLIMLFLILLFSTIFFIMYKYYVEGEKTLPFNITKLIIGSSAKTENIEKNGDKFEANVIQNNDIYIAIEKNENYSKEEAIKKITFNNFRVLKPGDKGTVKVYRTCEEEVDFQYVEKYQIQDKIEYTGAQETNLKAENMTISNQGGLLKLSITIEDLGKITYLENDDTSADGTLLNRMNINIQDIETTVAFDVIIELSSGNIFKTTINLDLPVGYIKNEGASTEEYKDLSKLVFKRS